MQSCVACDLVLRPGNCGRAAAVTAVACFDCLGAALQYFLVVVIVVVLFSFCCCSAIRLLPLLIIIIIIAVISVALYFTD